MTLVWRPGFQFDADASTYIEAVEAADTQALETGVRYAINDFVLGCKNDGIWNAIKASCILAGARTLDGALVPLVGTAPTNYNFVAGDYNRKTGLVGDGSTKYLNANRTDNADPQNNSHRSVYVSTAHTNPPLYGGYIGNASTSPIRLSFILSAYDQGNRLILLERSPDGIQEVSGSTQTGFIGTSRSTSTQSNGRASGSTTTFTITSAAPTDVRTFVFARNFSGVANSHTNARLSFYSIGESLDLALLDTRVSDLITAIGAAIP